MSHVCKDCTNRVLGCHSNCKLYLDWKAEHDRIRDIHFKEIMKYYRVPKKKMRGRDVWKPYQ